MKSGTNGFHGGAYYYFPDEFFASKSAFLAPSARTARRFAATNWGASVGGPIKRGKLFFFLNYEHQKFIIGAQSAATEPTDQWVNNATTLLTAHKVPVSQTSLNLLTALWPYGNKPGSATPNTILDTVPRTAIATTLLARSAGTSTPKQDAFGARLHRIGLHLGNAGANIYEYCELAPALCAQLRRDA